MTTSAVREEHAIWEGSGYAVFPEKWAILGFSHYDRDWTQRDRSCGGLDAKKADFTLELLRQTVESGCDLRFFRDIAKACGAADLQERQAFWNRVVFFNYLPACVDASEMYRTATKAEQARGNQRFCEALQRHRPDRVLVFSKKAWKLLPPTDEEKAGQPLTRLGVLSYEAGTYSMDGYKVRACCLQHPTHADHALLRAGVQAFVEQCRCACGFLYLCGRWLSQACSPPARRRASTGP